MKKILIPFLLVALCAVSCNEDFGDYFDQELAEFPPENIENVESITKDDELYSYLNLVSRAEDSLTDVGCIEFIYPFILFQFDENDNYLNQVTVEGNKNFASLLDELQDDFSIGLSYPISGTLFDGTQVSVNSNEELRESLKTCIEEELEIVIGNCNAIVEDCIWKVKDSEPKDSTYIDSYFTLREDGSVVFSVLQKIDSLSTDTEEQMLDSIPSYTTEKGTWVFYFIGADLHMNINLGPIEEDENGMTVAQDSIKADWNFDWKVNYIDLTQIKIEKSYMESDSTENGESEELITQEYTIEKECEEDEANQDNGD